MKNTRIQIELPHMYEEEDIFGALEKIALQERLPVKVEKVKIKKILLPEAEVGRQFFNYDTKDVTISFSDRDGTWPGYNLSISLYRQQLLEFRGRERNEKDFTRISPLIIRYTNKVVDYLHKNCTPLGLSLND